MKWMIGASVIAIAMGWAATTTIPAATITPDEATLKLLPSETQGVAFIDVAALHEAPLVKEALASGQFQQFHRDLDRLKAETGFDVHRDLQKVTVATLGPQQMLAIAQGQYDKLKIEQLFNEKGHMTSEVYLGRTLYGDEHKAVTFIDNLIILGDRNTVKKAVDQMSLPGSQPLRGDLLDAIRTIEAGSQVWAVGDFSIHNVPVGIPGRVPAAEMLKSFQSGTYQMRVDRDVHAKAVCTFTDAEAAKNLSDMARGFLAVAKLQVAKEPDLLHLLDGIQVSSSGTSVVVNIDEPGELLMKMPKASRQMRELHK